MNWNIRSVKKSLFGHLGKIRPDIICFQEIRNHKFTNTTNYHFVNKLRPDGEEENGDDREADRKGGGICVGIGKNLLYQDKSELVNSELGEFMEYLLI